ncbi:MAG TPA: YdeI/OmpD-associated family protein [Opitutaceae bacterium]
MKKEFKAKLEPRGPKGAWTFMQVPFDVHEVFGSRGRVPVSGTANGFAFRNSLMPKGDGHHEMMFSKELQAGARAVAGDTIRVSLWKDEAERTVTVPRELTNGLARDKKASDFFKTLPYSSRKEYSDWVASAKQSETKASRVERALALLASGRKRL